MATYRGLRRLWQPPAETLEAIAGVLGEHWRAAARSRAARAFWATPVSWLAQRAAVTVVPVRVTTSPPVAGSSGTPPGPHRY